MSELRTNTDPSAEDEACPLEVLAAVPATVSGFAEGLVAERRLGVGFESAPLAVTEIANAALMELFEQFSDQHGFTDFVDWLNHWMRQFGAFTQASHLRIKLVHANRPMCPRFHTDNVRYRLISALFGPGSEWLRTGDVQIDADGRVVQNPEPELIQYIQAGSVAYFRGTAGETVLRKGVVHRSPNQEVDRVVLTMDIAN